MAPEEEKLTRRNPLDFPIVRLNVLIMLPKFNFVYFFNFFDFCFSGWLQVIELKFQILGRQDCRLVVS